MTKDFVDGIGHSPVCQTLLQIVVRAVITSSPPAWTSSAWILSTPLRYEGWGDRPLGVSGDSSVLMDLHWSCGCTTQSSIPYLSLFCEAFS